MPTLTFQSTDGALAERACAIVRRLRDHGFTGIDMVTFRVTGGAVLFWLTSLFMPKEHVPKKDLLMLIGAAVFGLVTNQCCYTIGLSITSPVNASIVTTSMPIFAIWRCTVLCTGNVWPGSGAGPRQVFVLCMIFPNWRNCRSPRPTICAPARRCSVSRVTRWRAWSR